MSSSPSSALEGSGTFHPEQANSKLTQETHGGGESGLCHRAETKADIVIRKEGLEHCMGAAVHI